MRYVAIVAALFSVACAPTMTLMPPDLDRSQPGIVNFENYKLERESGHWLTLNVRYNRQLEPVPDGVGADYTQLFLAYPALVPKLRVISGLGVVSGASYLAGCLSLALWSVYADDRSRPYDGPEGIAAGAATGALLVSGVVLKWVGSYLFGQLGDAYNAELRRVVLPE